jgi:hypothetical protein
MRGSSRIYQDSKAMELQGRFSKWLRSSQPVFWINSKAGSDKSSLMSFIESHERTNDLLKIWASGQKLHVFSFFFWTAGSNIQNSIPGLLAPVIESTLSGVFEEAKPLRAFWLSLIHRSQGEDLITRFEKIKS